LRQALHDAGLTGDELVGAIACVDSHGLLVADQPLAEAHKREFAWPAALAASRGLAEGRPRDLGAVVAAFNPTVLIGIAGQPGAFTEAIIRRMSASADRPLILPMSNPTSQSEATPVDVIAWSEGRALVATGSLFHR
jgi:malate dehydrogenase (oxaloacetate-decarboxylating)